MIRENYEALKEKIEQYLPEGIVVAFSGGVDSALLLKMACLAAGRGEAVYAVTVRTKLHPTREMEEAAAMAKEFGVPHRVLEIDELAEAGIETNPVNRCYLCKLSIFRKIKELAEELGAGCVLEGTNEDDLHQYRPGIRALLELGILSPLAEFGLRKEDVRELAAYLGISAAKRPSAPCLATRLPYGTRIEYGLLARIDEGERYLRALGCYNVRLRVHELTEEVNAGLQNMGENQRDGCGSGVENGRKWLARIEVDQEDMAKLLDHRNELVDKIKGLGFGRVSLDLEGFRSGSMDIKANRHKK